MSNVIPLTMPQISWPAFIEQCQEVLGCSPTRKLDKKGIGLLDPRAFVLAANMENKDSMREGLRLVSFSFLVEGTVSTFLDIAKYFDLEIFFKENPKTSKGLMILSGTLLQWIVAIKQGCNTEWDTEIIIIFNECFDHFVKVGFSNLWEDCKKSRYKMLTILEG